jgi:uncharacterized UPF0146 family protein
MKKVILILISLTLFNAASAQTPVTDAAAIAGQLVGFTNSLTQALATTNEVLNVTEEARKTVDELQKMRDMVEKVNRYMYQMQSVVYAVQDLAAMADMITEMSRQMRISNYFSPKEMVYMVDFYTNTLSRANNNVGEIRRRQRPA